MYLLLFVSSIACGIVVGSLAQEPLHYDIEQAEQLFQDFIITYEKLYPSELEKRLRFEIFKDSLKRINEKNTIGGAEFKVNYFADLREEEFRQQFLGFEPSIGDNNCETINDAELVFGGAPESVNWVERGAVTGVKNQGHCGSCWAFATIGNIEGQHFIKNKKLLSLSEQELVDCSTRNGGCQGGDMAAALTDLIDIGGVELESTYPYVATEQSCQFDKSKVVTKLVGCTIYKVNEDKLMQVLAEKGPLIIGINANDLKYYNGGVINKAHCSERPMTHAVLLVGYGTDTKGINYWLIKNSWGSTFGESGYFKITRGENTCGILTFISTSEM